MGSTELFFDEFKLTRHVSTFLSFRSCGKRNKGPQQGPQRSWSGPNLGNFLWVLNMIDKFNQNRIIRSRVMAKTNEKQTWKTSFKYLSTGHLAILCNPQTMNNSCRLLGGRWFFFVISVITDSVYESNPESSAWQTSALPKWTNLHRVVTGVLLFKMNLHKVTSESVSIRMSFVNIRFGIQKEGNTYITTHGKTFAPLRQAVLRFAYPRVSCRGWPYHAISIANTLYYY
jgi:hypothetical protein